MFSNVSIESSQNNQKYRWYILALSTATATFVVSITASCMPVLFEEISDDMGLSLIQIGTVWGISNLGGVFFCLIAGLLTDRFRMKLTLIVFCVLAGISGALRGISDSYLMLAVTVFINGIFRLFILVNVIKAVGAWFKDKNLGLAMGIMSMGFGLGFTLGPMISATILSPALGGWRNVMYFYGALSALVGILWILFGREPYQADSPEVISETVPIRQAFLKLIRLKPVWLIGLALLFRVGSVIGVTGYIPLYLRGQGWDTTSADGTLSAFFMFSTIFVIPLSFLSDRIGSRKAILYPALIVTIICFALLPIVEGGAVLALMLLAGISADGFTSISITMLHETEGLELIYSGIAVGTVLTMMHIGNVTLPPLGNSLATISAGSPFFLWAGFSALALVTLTFIRETGRRGTMTSKNEKNTHL